MVTLLLANGSNPCEASSNRNSKHFWKTTWRLNVPNKVKSFEWCVRKIRTANEN